MNSTSAHSNPVKPFVPASRRELVEQLQPKFERHFSGDMNLVGYAIRLCRRQGELANLPASEQERIASLLRIDLTN